jgi:hydroxyacylglutathione hydrolase
MDLQPIPIFSDNYVWLLRQGHDAVVVDPGDAGPVRQVLAQGGLQLRAVLITHWHPDHIGGLPQLCDNQDVPVYGPLAEAERIPHLTHPLADGDTVEVLGRRFSVMATPGHTLGHIVYWHDDVLLCGDTLFSAGCGRLFEGTPAQMYASLSRLAALPDSTRIYCTHEYTAANLAFARAVDPDNADLKRYSEQVRELRSHNRPTLPSSLGLEKRVNPFLRCSDNGVRATLKSVLDIEPKDSVAVFAALRAWKDRFVTPKT